MRTPRFVTIIAVLVALTGSRAGAQDDAIKTHPNVYHLQFENDWLRVIRVNVPVYAQVSDHVHPPGLMLHVYLNDADPITFVHSKSAIGTVTRPAVTARSYRLVRTGFETHSIVNQGRGASDFLRIEFKTQGHESQSSRGVARPVTPRSSSVVEVANAQLRITRVTVATQESYEVAATATEPALLIALTGDVTMDGSRPLTVGQERFVDVGRHVTVRPSGFAAVQLLRVDLLTPPAKGEAK
jgi:mannose-6-phosphate isomerase-like protein (cupin superfamily)